MLIQISIEETQPLRGSASTDGREPVAFVGWLEMLRVIADLTEAAEQDAVDGAGARERSTSQNERDRSES